MTAAHSVTPAAPRYAGGRSDGSTKYAGIIICYPLPLGPSSSSGSVYHFLVTLVESTKKWKTSRDRRTRPHGGLLDELPVADAEDADASHGHRAASGAATSPQ